jgi:hypothetical protein
LLKYFIKKKSKLSCWTPLAANRTPNRIRALSAASAAKFNIAPVRWQHPSHVAIVPPESKGKTEGNDWDTACGNFKTSISSIYHKKNVFVLFHIQNNFEINYASVIWWQHLPAACNNFFEAGVSGNGDSYGKSHV